jgi:predicted  nucleic acid-binding Zn-ribbon protein
MDVLEPLQATVEEISSKGRAVNAALGQARLALEAAHKQIEAELNMQVELRSTLAAAVAPAQLSEYDRMRKNMGGVAVARFSGSQCHGCDLNRHWGGAEIEQLRAQSAQSLGRCEDCGRIVVES